MVIWSQPAKADLKHIHDYIAKDSKYYAKKVAQEIREKVDILDTMPRSGKIVPEIEKPDIRELYIYAYRIIYEIKNDSCNVLAIIHQRRDFNAENLL